MTQPEAIKNELKKEFESLSLVLQYCTEKTAMLKPGERIMINQQRAYLLRLIEGEDNGFIQSDGIVKKTENILQLIKKTHWKPTETTIL